MRPITQQLLFLTWTILSVSGIAQTPSRVQLPEVDMDRILFERAFYLRHHMPDSSQKLFELCFQNLMEKGDTSNAIYTLMEQAKTYGHEARYKDSYDKLWTALLLADDAGLEQAKGNIYLEIGRYYSFYKRRTKALEYFDLSLGINRSLVAFGKRDPAFLADVYHAYCSTFREIGEPDLARIYLDSCFQFHSPGISEINVAYLNFEKAFLLTQEGKYEEALTTFQKAIPWFKENNPGYQVLVYTYMGDTHLGRGGFSRSEACFLQALQFSEKHSSHIDFTPLIHERLADLYYRQKKFQSAFESLSAAKKLDEKFFDSRSQNNRPLLEILDAFRLEKEAQKEMLREQRLSQLEHEERVLFLQRTILIVSLAFFSVDRHYLPKIPSI